MQHNFNGTFERSDFKGEGEEVQRFANGLLKKNRDGIPMTETKPRTKGCVKPSFIKANKLTSYSHPAEFFSPFLPFDNNPRSTKNIEYLSFQLWTKWKNLKAILMGAGEGGTMYSDWKPFTSRELRHHFGLYMFNGLSSSPTIERKFKHQSEDPVHGNGFI